MAAYNELHFASGPETDALKRLILQAAGQKRGCVDDAAAFLGVKPNTLYYRFREQAQGLPWSSVLAMVHYANYPLLNKWYLFPDTRWVQDDPLTPPTDNLEKEVLADPVLVLGQLVSRLRDMLRDGRIDAMENQELHELYNELEQQLGEGRAALRVKGFTG